ncbi:eukaryotic translation initiation factor 5 [Anaeramoeba ignava]|uniref:Eukaryotic translation initiation factor 5 n=1 Tax=Anaeramoeba ignava TaxID=1746090 RepID=A0A9Q0L6N0_ANAIG|nr:eukaryotic translation initiation factor 5 [Anaeramoeba ignava]
MKKKKKKKKETKEKEKEIKIKKPKRSSSSSQEDSFEEKRQRKKENFNQKNQNIFLSNKNQNEKKDFSNLEQLEDQEKARKINEFLNYSPRPGMKERLELYFELFPQYFNGWYKEILNEKKIGIKISIQRGLFNELERITKKDSKNIKRGICDYLIHFGFEQINKYTHGSVIFELKEK